MYFPQNCVVSLPACGPGDPGVEIALAGYEGVVCISIFLGAPHSSLRAARCARWLLMAHGRVGGERFLLTQAFLGQMLGVQRSTVSASGGRLQSLGLIEYARGRLAITNRAGLEGAACDCYALMEEDYRSIFAR